jgi:hypothetical protein
MVAKWMIWWVAIAAVVVAIVLFGKKEGEPKK